ncbi:rRNA pseudouridine synthase [Candidatus Wolfebacteria bacterium]|nr:rRNA pseudouridine synthase [Candidatus Wolfebacteria bacterium]
MRIQKYFSQNKIMSRREAEDCVKKGLISCNGKIVRKLGFQIDPEKDKIKVLKPAGKNFNDKITIALNKPRGIVCSKNKSEGKTIFEISEEFSKLNAVGRLDKESEGLIFLSNDGVITSIITGSDHKPPHQMKISATGVENNKSSLWCGGKIEKEYEIKTRENLNMSKIRKMESGIMLDDGLTLPAKARLMGDKTFRIILKEGRKHQIRRMAAALGLTIVKLKRIRIGNIILGKLVPGEHRKLSEKEIENLKNPAK